METLQTDYFTAYHNVKLTRDANGVLIVQVHTNGGACVMTAQTHTEFVEAFTGFAGSSEQDRNPDGRRRRVHY